MSGQPLAFAGPACVHIHHGDDSPRRRNWQIPHRRLEYWLVVTSLGGSERIVVDGRGYDVRPGDSYVIQPGVLHDLGSVRGNIPAWIHFDVLFDPRRSQPRRHAGPYDADLGPRSSLLQPGAVAMWGVDLPVLVPADIAALVADEVQAVIARLKPGTPPGRLEAEARLALLLARLVARAWRDGGGETAPTDEDRIARAEGVARQRLDGGFGLHDFAEAAGLGRSRFCQIYARLRGEAPGAFLRRARHERAEAMLRSTGLPLAQVARLSGYADATVFVRAFRRATGTTPAVWRDARRA